MLYNVGDVVLVRSDLSDGVYYNNSPESIDSGGEDSIICVDEMTKYAGEPVHIIRIVSVYGGDSSFLYRIEEDGDQFWWSDGMFDGLYEEYECSFEQLNPSDLFT